MKVYDAQTRRAADLGAQDLRAAGNEQEVGGETSDALDEGRSVDVPAPLDLDAVTKNAQRESSVRR